MALTLLDEVSRLLAAWEWRLESDAQGIRRHVNDGVASALQTVAVWSMKGSVEGRQTTDTIQVEVLVRIHGLEEFITSHLGSLYANEMGKTVSVFLHRLIPEGRRFAQGFLLEGHPSSSNASCAQVIELLSEYGFPFALEVATGNRLLDDKPLDPRLVDPMKWEVRRVLFALAYQLDAEPAALLRAAAVRMESGLKAKFDALAQFSRSVDSASEIKMRLDAFIRFAERVEHEKGFVAEVRRRIARHVAS